MSKYRLYIDESGDHCFNEINSPDKRFFALLGCIFEEEYYINSFQPSLESLKRKYFNYHPDEPVILHREDIIHKKGPFVILKNPEIEKAFNNDLVLLLKNSDYIIILIVIDKKALKNKYDNLAYNPYNFGLELILERYLFFLNSKNGRGDVLAEERGGKEDKELKEVYKKLYNEGGLYKKPEDFQKVLTSKEIKLKTKKSNIAGIQLCDIIAHPLKQKYLFEKKKINEDSQKRKFREVIYEATKDKYLKDKNGEIEGYGRKIIP